MCCPLYLYLYVCLYVCGQSLSSDVMLDGYAIAAPRASGGHRVPGALVVLALALHWDGLFTDDSQRIHVSRLQAVNAERRSR